MNMKKKTFALAAILTAGLLLAGCGQTEEGGSSGSSTVESQSETEPSKADSQDPGGKADQEESPDAAPTDPAAPDSSSEADAGEADYEPLTIDCSEILSSGDTSYFELTHRYGDACTVIQRYLYESGSYNGGVIRVEPGTETDLAAIINNAGVLEGGSPSYFTEDVDGWSMVREASEEEKEYMNSFSIEELRTLFWGMALMSEGYSQEEAEAIVGVSGEPQMPYVADDPSVSAPDGITWRMCHI